MVEHRRAGAARRRRQAPGDAGESREWAVKNVGGGLLIAAAVLVSAITILTEVRHEPYAMNTSSLNYVLSALLGGLGLVLVRVRRPLPAWLTNSLPSATALLICIPTSVDDSPAPLGPLLLTWPVTFSAAVLSARTAWVTMGVAAAAFAFLAAFSRGSDGVVLWIEVAASLTVVCWMVVRLQRQSLRLREALTNLARTDPLTGLLNRRGFDEVLVRECSRRTRGGAPMAVLLVDIDHFKRVNDRWGHQAGDSTLHDLGALLASRFRTMDTVGRIGGEEFAVLIPDCAATLALETAQRLCDNVREETRAWAHPITVSVGIATSSGSLATPSQLLAAADAALYAAKAAGRDRVELAQSTPPSIMA